MDERRKTVRVNCDISCRYDDAPSRASNCPETVSSALTKDLSGGGARLVVFEFLPIVRKIRLQLEIPFTEPIEAVLEVSWVCEIPHQVRHFEIGGRFTSVAEDRLNDLRRYVNTEAIRHAA